MQQQLDEHTTAILEAVTDIIADSERAAKDHVLTLGNSVAGDIKILGERQEVFAEDLSRLIETAASQAEAFVRDRLREERLDLGEALFAAKLRYDGLIVSLQAGLAAIRDGEPGPPGVQGEPGPPGLSGLSFRIRGTWLGINEYRALDVVALGGASFAARHDDPGPCPGDGWQLIAAQGKRGNQGDRGPAGAKGDQGEAGPPVVALTVSEEGALTLTNGDGTTVTCDLYPVLAKVAR